MPRRNRRQSRSDGSRWSGWQTLRHMPGAFLVTSAALIVIGFVFEWVVIFTFLATTTYVLTDVIMSYFLTAEPGYLKILKRAPFSTRGEGYLVLLAFILIIAPLVALLVYYAPVIISQESVGIGAYSHPAVVLGFAFGSTTVVYCYLRWLTWE